MYNNSPDVRYMPDVNYMPDVQYMPSVKYMSGVSYMPSVTYGPTQRGLLQTPYSSVGNSSNVDGMRVETKINSLIDVAWPWATEARELLIKDTPWLDWYTNSDQTNFFDDYLFAIAAVVYNNVVQPWTQINDDYTVFDAGKETLFNSLNALGEDADILSNIVKSQVTNKDNPIGGGFEEFKASIGWGQPRKAYSYDTGNVAADIVLEVISDPLTYVSIVTGLAGAGSKAAISGTVKGVLAKSGIEVSDDAADLLTETIIKTLAKSDADDELVENVIQIIGKEAVRETSEETLKAAAREAITATRLSNGYKVYKATNVIKSIDEGWTKASQWTTVAGPITLLKPYAVKMVKSLYSSIIAMLSDTDLANYFITKGNVYKEIAGSTIAKNNAAYKTELKSYEESFFKKLNTNPTKMQNEILKELGKKQVFDENFDIVEDFMKILDKEYKSYNTLLAKDEALQKIIYADFKNKIVSDEFKELVTILYTGPVAIDSAHRYQKLIKFKGTNESLKKYLSKNEDDIIKLYSNIDNFLTYDNVHYGLNDLDSYLKLLVSNPNISKEYLNELIATLESFGITRENAKDISKILNSRMKKKDIALKELLEKSNGMKLLEDTHYTKRMNKLENKIKDNMGSEINKFFTKDLPSNSRTEFEKYLEKPLINMEDAVKKIQSNEDIERATLYIQSFIRSEYKNGLPEADTLNKQLEVALKAIAEDKRNASNLNKISRFNNYHIDTESIAKTNKFLKQTERIMTSLDKDVSVISDIPEWYTNLKPMIADLKKLRSNLYEGSYATVQLRGSVDKLIDALTVFTEDTFVENITNYISDGTNMYVRQISHYGEYNVLVQHTHLSENPNIKRSLDLLSNKESVYRTKIIPDLLDAIEPEAPAYAKNIRTVLAQIDTVNNMVNILDPDLVLPFELSNKTKEELKNILFDKINNNRFTSIAKILSEDNAKLEDITYKTLTNSKSNIKISYRDLIKQQISEAIDQTEPLKNEIASQLKGVKLDNALEDIKAQLNQRLDIYIQMQDQIGKDLNIDNIALSTLYSKDTVDIIQTITSMETKFDLARIFENKANSNISISTELISEYETLANDLDLLKMNLNETYEDIAKIDNKLRVPMKYYEMVKELRKVSEQHNLYSASMESQLYTTRRIVAKHYDTGDNIYLLTKDKIIGTIDEYTLLTDNLKIYQDHLFNDFEYDTKYIEGLRKSLIDTYSRNTALYRPVNPLEYFNRFDITTEAGQQAILGWSAFTNASAGINNKSAFITAKRKYITQQKYLNRLTTDDILSKVQEVYNNAPIVDDESLSHLVTLAHATNSRELVNDFVEANFLSTLHSIDDLGKNRRKVNMFLKKDVETFKDIVNETIDIENMPNLKKDLAGFKTKQDLADFANVSYGYEEALNKPLVQAYKERKASLASYIGHMNPDELATYMYHYTEGALVFYNNDIVLTKNIDGSMSYGPLENIFNFSKKELKDAGIAMKKITDEQGDKYYFRLLDRRERENYLVHYEPELFTGNKELQERVTNLIDKYKIRLNIYGEDAIPSNLLTVETLNQDTWNKFLQANEDFFGGIEEQNLYLNRNKKGISKFFSGSFERLNLSVIGGGNTYNMWNMAYSNNFIPHSLSLTTNTLNGLTALVNRSNKINKYLTLFWNKDWSLAESPLLIKMFEEADDKQIKDFFAKDNYKVVLLKKDLLGLPKVYEYTVYNRYTLAKAAKAGGILVPRETFAAMRKVVNSRVMSNDLLSVYRRLVPSTYKSLYLFTPGFLFRNALDSLLYKNINEVGLKAIDYELEASKALKLYDQIQKEALDVADDSTFGKTQLLEVLSHHTQDEIDVYYLTDLFITSEASGGLSQSLADYLEEYNKAHTDDIRWLWEQFYEDKILFGKQPYNPLYLTRDINEHIEQTARFGLFLASVDSGYPVDDAIKRVVKTHFDYNTQHDLIELCEKIFWFSTFPINNFNYYVSGGMSRNPQLYRFLLDTQMASWNNGEYTYEELKKTNFLSYHAMVGNLRIGNYIIKTSPSVFDFLNLISDPIGNIKDRLNPFIATATGLVEKEDILEELNPLQTQLRDIAKIYKEAMGEEGGSWIPSIYSKINDYKYIRSAGRWRVYSKTSSPVYTKYPKIRKAHAYTAYVRHYYAKRYHTNVRKFTRTRIRNIDSNFYRLSRRRGPTYFESIWT